MGCVNEQRLVFQVDVLYAKGGSFNQHFQVWRIQLTWLHWKIGVRFTSELRMSRGHDVLRVERNDSATDATVGWFAIEVSKGQRINIACLPT